MERIPEPELMDDPRQARAYAGADFCEPHERFVALFAECFPGVDLAGAVLDLGCGPADVSCRFALAHPRCILHGVDGAAAMLAEGRRLVAARGLGGRVRLHHLRLPSEELPAGPFAAVISNSLLHHLADPAVLWHSIAATAAPGAPVFVMDLLRPASEAQAQALVAVHAAGEPEILRRDFHHSLRAAYRPIEVRQQLAAAGLGHFTVRAVSDRHLIAYGRMTGG